MRVATVLLACAALSACDLRSGDPATAERELRAANAEYDAALIDGDAKALDRFYTADYSIIDDDADVHGKADQIAFMTKNVDLLQARSDDLRIKMLGPNAAMLTGRLTGRYRMDGKEDHFVERYTSIWVREEGAWRVQHEHASIVPKAEPALAQ